MKGGVEGEDHRTGEKGRATRTKGDGTYLRDEEKTRTHIERKRRGLVSDYATEPQRRPRAQQHQRLSPSQPAGLARAPIWYGVCPVCGKAHGFPRRPLAGRWR